MNAQERLDKVLETAQAEIDDVCLVATLTLPDSGAMNWAAAAKFYNCFFGAASIVAQSEPTVIVGGVGESHYETACIIVEELRAMIGVEILLDPTHR